MWIQILPYANKSKSKALHAGYNKVDFLLGLKCSLFFYMNHHKFIWLCQKYLFHYSINQIIYIIPIKVGFWTHRVNQAFSCPCTITIDICLSFSFMENDLSSLSSMCNISKVCNFRISIISYYFFEEFFKMTSISKLTIVHVNDIKSKSTLKASTKMCYDNRLLDRVPPLSAFKSTFRNILTAFGPGIPH